MTAAVIWCGPADNPGERADKRRRSFRIPVRITELDPAVAQQDALPQARGRWGHLDEEARAERWLDRMRTGEERALEQLVRACYAPVAAVALRYAGNREIAEEVTQDIFVNLWERCRELEITGGLMAYLFAAAHHRAINARAPLRERAQHVTSEIGLAAAHSRDNPELLYDAVELSQALRATVDGLSPRGREVFLLSRRDGLTPAQIASSLGISVQTVYTLLARALQELHKVIDPLT